MWMVSWQLWCTFIALSGTTSRIFQKLCLKASMWPILTVSWWTLDRRGLGALGASPPCSDFFTCHDCFRLVSNILSRPNSYFFHSRQVYALSRIPRENHCSWGSVHKSKAGEKMEIVDFDSHFCVREAKELIKVHSGSRLYPWYSTPASGVFFSGRYFLVFEFITIATPQKGHSFAHEGTSYLLTGKLQY